MEGKKQEQEVDDEADDAIGADVGVLHDVEDALAVLAPSAEAVHEVGQPVLVQGTSHKQPCDDGQQDGNLVGEQVAAEIDDSTHHRAREPTHERPVFDNGLVSLLRWLVQSPEGQSGEKDEGCPDAVIPFGGVDRYLHGLFYFYGNTTDHEDDFVGLGCHILVHPAHEVGEPALDGIGAHSARAYLVGDKDEGGVL